MRFDGKLCQGELPGKYLKAYIKMLKLISAILSDTKLLEKDYKKYENELFETKIVFCLCLYKILKYFKTGSTGIEAIDYKDLAKNKHYIEKFEMSFNI